MAGGRSSAGTGGGRDFDRERFTEHLARSSFYPYPGPPDGGAVRAEQRHGALRVTEASFRSPIPSGFDRNDVVTVRLFERAARAPDRSGRAFLFLHGFGARRLAAWDSLPRAMASRGFPALLVGIPYLCERTPAGMRGGSPYMSTTASAALPAYEQAVADVRASLDWLIARGLGEGAALVGVSMGALLSVIAAALEPRFAGVVPILGGGDLDVIVFDGHYRTTVPRELREARVSMENRRRARVAYAEYLGKVRTAPHPLAVPAPFHFFLFDPLTFASHLRTRPAAMVNARLDPIIPRAAAVALCRELGSPGISWLWGTHWAGGPWQPAVVNVLTAFLDRLSREPRRAPSDLWASLRMP